MSRAYSRAHYMRLSNGCPDTDAQILERIKRRAAGEKANAEMMERFAPITSDNAREAIAWQERRIAALMEAV